MEELVDYIVLTKCGRRFGWAASGLGNLFRDMLERNYEVTFVMPLDEYMALDLSEYKELELKHSA